MKILLIQLARLGDIYQTWPGIRALRRKYPDAEIHFLVREKFSAACSQITEIDQFHYFKTKEIFYPLFNHEMHPEQRNESVVESFNVLVEKWKNIEFDEIHNLSYSPLSSYLTHLISSNKTQRVTGYTRHEDGFFLPAGDLSAYFFAQVGVGRDNRFHITDLFAEQMGLVLEAEDLSYPAHISRSSEHASGDYVILHIGASNEKKSLSTEKLHNTIRRFQKLRKEKLVLIGSNDEIEKSKKVLLGLNDERVLSLVGQTKLDELFPLIQNAKLYVGADSGPLQICSFTDTPALNYSNSFVNYWETGPRSKNSRVLFVEHFSLLSSDTIVNEMISILEHTKPSNDVISFSQDEMKYIKPSKGDNDFSWQMIQAMYQGYDFPLPEDFQVYDALFQLREINDIAIDNLKLNDKDYSIQSSILDRVDEIILKISEVCSSVAPIARWYRTEKIKIGPGDIKSLMNSYLNVHKNLDYILSFYIERKDSKEANP